MKTNTISINIYLNKLIQKLIANIIAREFNLVIETITMRIRCDIKRKKNRKSKFKSTLLQLKRK